MFQKPFSQQKLLPSQLENNLSVVNGNKTFDNILSELQLYKAIFEHANFTLNRPFSCLKEFTKHNETEAVKYIDGNTNDYSHFLHVAQQINLSRLNIQRGHII